MELVKLIDADIHRDGGSYHAAFETDDGRTYSVLLQHAGKSRVGELNHRWLFEYFGAERPENCQPIVTGSVAERLLFRRLNGFLSMFSFDASVTLATPENEKLDRLKELVSCAERREPCFPHNLIEGNFA